MKQFILTIVVLSATIIANAQQRDTLTIEQPERVTISKTPASTQFVVEGNKDNPNYRYEELITLTDSTIVETASSDKRNSSFCLDFTILENKNHTSSLEAYSCLNMNVSFGIPTGDKCIPTRFFRSGQAEIDLIGFRYLPVSPKWCVELDWGIELSRYYLKKDKYLLSDPDGFAHVYDVAPGMDVSESMICCTGSNLNLMYRRYFGKTSSIGLGAFWKGIDPLLCRTTYTDQDGKEVVKTGHFAKNYVNRNLFGLRLQYRMDMLQLNVDYMLNNTFKKGYGIELPRLSVGFGVCF